MHRLAAIDVGTNSVLLLVAERNRAGTVAPVLEVAEITRLGRGVDRSRQLSATAIDETVQVITEYVKTAHKLSVDTIVIAASSAARDATNGDAFLRRVKDATGIDVRIISGDEEARLSFEAAWDEFGASDKSLVVLDIGGGSTEFIYGQGGLQGAKIQFKRSYDLGSVRLTERYVNSDPITAAEQNCIKKLLRDNFAELPIPSVPIQVIGLAGTVTTLFAIEHQIEPYDASRVQGQILTLRQISALAVKLGSLGLDERRKLPGLQPKRADVIPAGALILQVALESLGSGECVVSDRGLRWGLLNKAFRDDDQNNPMLK